MAVKRAKTSKRSAGGSAPSKVTRLSTVRKKLAGAKSGASGSKKAAVKAGPAKQAPAKKKAAVKKAPAVVAVAVPKTRPVLDVVESALDEMKAVNVKVLAVKKLTDITDTMIIASGNSDRHVRSIADRVVEHAKKAGFRPMGVEGERDGEWVLVDLQDVIVHIMLPRVREFYRLESLWDISAARREAAEQSA
jgi:ribosome-associated protein